MIAGLAAKWTRQVGIDLGSATTRIHVSGRGVVLNEPTMAAVSRETGEILAVGQEAKRMWGRVPESVSTFQPVRKGVIANYEIAEGLLRTFISRACANNRAIRTTAVVGVPGGISEVERRAVSEAALRAGATEVYLVEESVASAIGSGIAPSDPEGIILVDIGAGTTEVAVITAGSKAFSKMVRSGGDELDAAIVSFMRTTRGLGIGALSAEQLKIDVGSASAMSREYEVSVKGRDLATGLPKAVKINSQEVRTALAEPLTLLAQLVRSALEEVTPELSADALGRGIMLTGGGSLLQGIDRFVASHSGLQVSVAKDPQSSVVRGAGLLVEQLNTSRAARRMVERISRN